MNQILVKQLKSRYSDKSLVPNSRKKEGILSGYGNKAIVWAVGEK
jgi:hypothetical protein